MTKLKEISVSFSGHRDLTPSEPDLFSGLQVNGVNMMKDEFVEQLRNNLSFNLVELYNQGYRYFLNGMACGFDLLAAEEVVKLKKLHTDIKLVAVIPFEAQDYKYPAAERTLYKEILGIVAEKIIVSESYRPDCYHKRNDYLVANSSVLISFYNGNGKGTAYTVKQALKNGLRVINLV